MNNKIMKEGLKPVFFAVFFLLCMSSPFAQKLPISPYGLTYINSITLYQKSLMDHPEKQMVSLAGIPGIILDLRYASVNNFLHKNLYPVNTKTTYLRKPAYQALDSVSRELARHGMVLVIFDAYRPYSVTIDLWNSLKDERYAANPAKGSGHNRGISVDLTLADAKTHELLPMPTGFDNFTDSAYQNYNKVDSKRIANRELLKRVMVKYGFIPLFSEWWHYSWPETGDFEVLDLSFEQLSEVEK
jgi:D-alanyl-D-alanine dipeptidase